MREDGDTLLAALIPFAERQLKAHGEFFPFGGTMGKDGKVALVAGMADGERPESDDVLQVLVDGMRAQAADLRATCVVSDCRVIPPGQSGKVDAIRAGIEHVDGEGVEVYFPYTVQRGLFGRIKGVAIEAPFAQAMDLTILHQRES